ncbi:hypothetical protein [Streptomyces sp. ICBB 8177]|uniref:hypothetical protein n=1 Tax=Streptomyces sp. ICBB 8177 TaxID=563922 RepID=UPI000D6798F3|nr:hypothetical protein [Streptomyces sp. ICBB 8177]PWI42153.1 hypothetical protein CK485_25695 [Streptomyces sp. ICBB 8177]
MRRTATRPSPAAEPEGAAAGEPAASEVLAPMPEAPQAAPAAPPQPQQLLRTEFEFELPRGYVDEAGTVHRNGTMRLATARDELIPLQDMRVRDNPAYLSVVLLGRVITRLGTLPLVHDGIVENLFASDLAFLQDFYRQVNAEGHTRAGVTCPHCEQPFEVELGGSRLGES